MTAEWRLELDLGPVGQGGHSWEINRGDPPVLPEILAGFRTGWATPPTDLWPVQPDPQVAVFSVLAAQAADLDAIQVGSPVHARFHAGATAQSNLWPTVDGTFEDPGTTFAANGGAIDPTRTQQRAHAGTWSLRCERGAGSSSLYTQRTDVAALLPAAGDYELTAWVYVTVNATGDNGLTMRGTGVAVNTDALATVRDDWQKLRIPFTYTGAGGVTLSVLGNGANPRLWLDDVQMRALLPTAVFAGAVGALDGRPRRFGHPDTGVVVDGWQLDVQAVDYAAQLGEANMSGEWSTSPGFGNKGTARNGVAWVKEALIQLGYPQTWDPVFDPPPAPWYGDGDHFPSGDDANQLYVLEEDLPPVSVRDFLEDVLRQIPDAGEDQDLLPTQGWRRGVIRPRVDVQGQLDSVTPYYVEWISKRNPSALNARTLPATFGVTVDNPGSGGDLYGPRITTPTSPPSDASVVLSADYLTRDVSWARTKFNEPDRVQVVTKTPRDIRTAQPEFNWLMATTTKPGAPSHPPPVTAVIETQQFLRGAAFDLGELYLGDDATPDTAWQPAGFTWHASEDPSWPQRLSWFPAAPSWLGWSVPVVITGVPASQSPNARPWHVGIPDAVDLVIEGGRFRFDFTLRPRTPRPYVGTNALTWDDLQADHPTVTHNDLDPAYDSTDYRLVRR